VQLLGRQFVLAQSIEEALQTAAASRKKNPSAVYSYDMLGEGARTEADAQRYLASYTNAIKNIAIHATNTRANGQNSAQNQEKMPFGPASRDGISIKLSALHPRYEHSQHARVMSELVPRVWGLCELAARADINLTIDAEEVDRLELSLDVLEALARQVSAHFPNWRGLGLALQAYQTRALELIAEVARIARENRIGFMCRLVKGAYWDTEIKRAQELGMPHYPVFTHKHHSDVSYLACAKALFSHADVIYPQFATHNAGTIAAIMQLAEQSLPAAAPGRPKQGGTPRDGEDGASPPSWGSAPREAGSVGGSYELQRLHGMGEGVYREVLKNPNLHCRIYAPVGAHRDLLAYLVRRLLENGANSSFVHQLTDEATSMQTLLHSPLRVEKTGSLPLPAQLYGSERANSAGVDVADEAQLQPLLAALKTSPVPQVPLFNPASAPAVLQASAAAFKTWSHMALAQRSQVLQAAANALEAQTPRFCALLVQEAHKTWGDAVAEVREAVDFLRYYAVEAERLMQPTLLPGVTGERNELQLRARGVWVCISPWNFPLAIFMGQVAAALATGNTVLAKPAEQTPGIAQAAVQVLHAAGVPNDAVQLCHGAGETVGAALVALPGVAGVVFTGSTQVAKIINRALAAKDGPIVPLIAETGGINAMLVDSSALPEQVCDAVIQSAYRSAGQRCSALRLLCVHESIADTVIEMVAGAARELRLGDTRDISTDVGPVIDREAYDTIHKHLSSLNFKKKVLPAGVEHAQAATNLIAPQLVEVQAAEDLRAEIFGPVLQVLRWSGDPAALIERINNLGYGLTLGIQTRIDSRALALAAQSRIGNVYVNRNIIGAVVGSQPFGGEGLSGTGPKAGGPHYLLRFCTEQTLTINTAAAGGNASLLAQVAAHAPALTQST
jgi:RHH-type transcriptional regulator, proline utilization regulon repressor / proline dehydrogenase / delta 1-pyrroline-5-carboxylate dehydrogenase